jgi:hypothetical protein
MKIADGNDKLGKNCIVVSRPVGDTCPIEGSDRPCAFFNNGCYAEATENQYKNARTAGFANVITKKNLIRSMILDAIKRKKSIRWHERGDFFIDNKLDTDYVDNITWACESVLADGIKLPKMWFYTHIYDPALVALGKFMSAYASVHNDDDMNAAKAVGFTKFAWCDSDKKIAPKRPKSKAKADAWRKELPKFVILNNERFVTCPEIRKGRTFVTCSGSKDSQACDMCINGRASVFFPCH